MRLPTNLLDKVQRARAALKRHPVRVVNGFSALGLLVVAGAILQMMPAAQTAEFAAVGVTRINVDVPTVLVDGKEDFDTLAGRCAPNVAPQTLRALVTTESAHNPFAIAVVGGKLDRIPTSHDEAIATINELERQGFSYSVGLAQVNNKNFDKYGQTAETLLNACTNLRVGANILKECYDRAQAQKGDEQQALLAALSCYYSGNFQRGFEAESNGTSYVGRVVAASGAKAVPAIAVSTTVNTRPARVRAKAGTEDWAMYANDNEGEAQ
jgi:type IV secretion system protein VirB1